MKIRCMWKNLYRKKNDRGSTMIEMVVCFALLGIFMASAAVMISNVTSIHYEIKGELLSREVSDILMEKMVSEIDGAAYYGIGNDGNPKILNGNSEIELTDKTDTHVTLKMSESQLMVHYHEILIDGSDKDPKSRNASDWKFDKNLYKGFYLTGLSFYMGGGKNPSDPDKYGLSSISMSDYPSNVVLILMKLKRQGNNEEYHYYRFVKMYNVPETNNPDPSPAP
ncbi:MAG: prepilin-type N-terminal cleavage/methylation domain-containing protein [Eubacterium sp.]|nr:prepilin-type N-terminal cleavage/methylation domain-containing protein [Eubacterium sp.]